MTVYYTCKGDDGSTGVMGPGRIGKDSPLAIAIGDIDELNGAIGVVIANMTDERISGLLKVIQDRLFTLGAELSSAVDGGVKPKATIGEGDIKDLEKEIDELASRLPELKKFVLPGGSVPSAYLQLARSVARRAERSAVALSRTSIVSPNVLSYLNRLSSFLFAAALYINKKEGVEEFNPSYS